MRCVRTVAIPRVPEIDWSVIEGLVLAVLPVFFVWHLEVTVTTGEINDGVLSNGFVELEPLVVYHVLMYALFAICWEVAYGKLQ